MKLLRSVNLLATKQKKRPVEDWAPRPIDQGKLRDRVYIKILEDCDNPVLFPTELLVQTCLLFDEFQFDADQARVIKEVY